MEVGAKSIDITRVIQGGQKIIHDLISVEEPLEIRIVSGKEADRKANSLSVTMRTPGHDEELAVGFLLTEGIIKQNRQIVGTEYETQNIIRIELAEDVIVDFQTVSRNFYTTSSCGVCGKTSIDAIRVDSSIMHNSFTVTASTLESLPFKIVQGQETFQSTGGLHASALFGAEGNLLLVREDVGRHNALDKIIGAMILANEFPLSNKILLVSGRASFELVQKAAVAGISIMAAIGAPSSLAVELAREKGITLIGFLKVGHFNIYAHPNRII